MRHPDISIIARRQLLAAILWLGMLAPFFSSPGQGGESNPGAAVVHLQYREADFAPLVWEVGIDKASFTKEPVLSNRHIFRGLFKLGADTNQFLPFLWDIPAGRLYLDLNRNRDLTDDAEGVLTASGRDVQLFRSLRLQFPTAQGTYQVLADAHVFEQGGTRGVVRTFLYVRSFWEGAIELGGKRWYVAVIDRPDGRIGPAQSLKEISDRMLLRPWEERDQPFLWWHASLEKVHGFSHVKLVTFPYRYAGNAELFDAFDLPANLFFQAQAYHLNCRPEPVVANKPANLELSLEPFQPPLGKMRLGGEYVRQAVLDNSTSSNGFTVVLDRPAAEVQVPVGVYPRQLVLLQREGFTNVAVGIATNAIEVTQSNLVAFDAGGPLGNRVEVDGAARYGSVSLHYQLTNRAGIQFHLAFQDRKTPPTVEIHQGANLVGTGKFEFG